MPGPTHFHQSWTSGVEVLTDQAYPIYWCLVPPKTAWSAGSLNIGFHSREVPLDRAGLIDLMGFFIPNAFGLDERIDLTPRQLGDKYLPLIDAQDFSSGSTVSEDNRVATLAETVLTDGQSDNNPATDDVQGRDAGDDNVQSQNVLRAPYVWNMVDWIGGLTANKWYDASTPVGTPYGKYILVDKKTQRYQAAWDLSSNMMGSQTGIGVVLIYASMAELGASKSGTADEATEQISPWDTTPEMLHMLVDAQDQVGKAMFELDTSNFQKQFKELADWKRVYSVGDDTWHNSDGKFYVRGSTTLTSFWGEDRTHI